MKSIEGSRSSRLAPSRYSEAQDVINKGITTEDLISSTKLAGASGAGQALFYDRFADRTIEDVEGIANPA